MKALNKILVLVLSLLALENTHAQKKIGVFIHGFQGSSEKWTEISKVPQNWESAKIIDGYIAIDYETLELKSESSRYDLILRFIAEMDAVGCELHSLNCELDNVSYDRSGGDQWILIGHSLGGIVARRIYPALRGAGFNLEAIVSVGGPSQGAAATDVDTADINKRLLTMENTFKEAYNYRRTYIELGVMIKDLLGGTNLGARIDAIPEYIKTARDSALGYAKLVLKNNAKSLIGREGTEIDKINGYSENNIANHPPNFLSIIGAEKDKAPIRMAGQIFEGVEELKDEDDMIESISGLRNDYVQRHIDYYDGLVSRYGMIHGACSIRYFYNPSKCSGAYSDLQHARYRRSVWKDARREIDDLGKTWSEIINSYRIETSTIRIYIPPCEDDGGFLGQFNILLNIEECSDNPEGEYRYKTHSFKISDKNDGVVNVHSALWSKNDTFDDLNNIYMRDVLINENGHDEGGFNHFELRNYARQYKLEENDQVVFSNGDPNPAMEEVENWISDDLRSFN